MNRLSLSILVLTCLLSGCGQINNGPKNAEEKYASASLAGILMCRGDRGLDQPGEAEAAWDKWFPGRNVYPFNSSPDGQEAIRILQMALDENCDFSVEQLDSVPRDEKIKLEKILNKQ